MLNRYHVLLEYLFLKQNARWSTRARRCIILVSSLASCRFNWDHRPKIRYRVWSSSVYVMIIKNNRLMKTIIYMGLDFRKRKKKKRILWTWNERCTKIEFVGCKFLLRFVFFHSLHFFFFFLQKRKINRPKNIIFDTRQFNRDETTN